MFVAEERSPVVRSAGTGRVVPSGATALFCAPGRTGPDEGVAPDCCAGAADVVGDEDSGDAAPVAAFV
ncbi:hypothetical protein, partial [Nocardia xishanensis]|uniref:hypothetical protein n=1 Tax=Nocardia xishanensis TaxID=238964 RepID=UPI001C3FAA0F